MMQAKRKEKQAMAEKTTERMNVTEIERTLSDNQRTQDWKNQKYQQNQGSKSEEIRCKKKT